MRSIVKSEANEKRERSVMQYRAPWKSLPSFRSDGRVSSTKKSPSSARAAVQTQLLAKTRYECSDHRDELASANEASLSLPARFHVGQCLACQAEMASYKKLRRWMRTLTEVEAPSSSALADQISFAIDQADLDLSRRRITNHLPAAIGVVSGGVAAAVGVFAVATRHKRVLRLPIPALST